VAGVRICRDTPVSELRRDRSGYSFRAGSGVAKADGVVVALPAPAAAALLGGVASAAVTDLGAVSYSGVALVALAWPSDAVPTDATWSSLVPGPQHGAAADRLSGVLVPRPQRDLVTACTFTSSKWPRSASPGRLLLRASVGSNDDDRHRSMDDSELVRRVTDDLRRIVGLGGKPTTVLVKRFDGSFPLYEQGHEARVARIRRHLAAAPGVAVAGAAFDGIGIPACIVSGRAAAETVAAALASTGGASTGGASRLAG
jgi:oxygen-dependent protoporphyrinogen oxidase